MWCTYIPWCKIPNSNPVIPTEENINRNSRQLMCSFTQLVLHKAQTPNNAKETIPRTAHIPLPNVSLLRWDLIIVPAETWREAKQMDVNPSSFLISNHPPKKSPKGFDVDPCTAWIIPAIGPARNVSENSVIVVSAGARLKVSSGHWFHVRCAIPSAFRAT